MKRIVELATFVGVMALSSAASANVSKVDVFAGRLAEIQSCFFQLRIAAVEQNMFNGQEKVKVGDQEIGTFAPLQSAGTTSLKVGDNILFGSDKFKAEVGFTPDIMIPDAACELLEPGATVKVDGSFGPTAGELPLPAEFSELDVVGMALLIHLESEKFKLQSLTGEKEIGGPSGGTTSGGTTSGGTTSGGTTSGGPTTPGTSGGTPPAGSAGGGDDSCAVTAAGAPSTTGSSLFAIGVLSVVSALALRRRRNDR